MSKGKKWLVVIVVFVLFVSLVGTIVGGGDEDREKTIADFKEDVEAGVVESVVFHERGAVIDYEKDGEQYHFQTPYSFYVANKDVFEKLEEDEVPVVINNSLGAAQYVPYVGLIFYVAIIGLIVVVVYMQYGKYAGKHEINEVTQETTTFEDVAGMRNVKDELQEIVGYLKDPSKFGEYTEVFPKGILLEGDPGNGKTLLARALAGETDSPFFQISASDIEGSFVGMGAFRVKNLFKEAKKSAREHGKAIMFIDEIDTIGLDRSKRTVAETNQTLNKLLTEMDGFEKENNILVIAATNLVEDLDRALTRSGRFDRIIKIPKPSYTDRKEVLNLYLKQKKKIVDEVVFEKDYVSVLGSQSEGFSSADLFRLVNDASLLAFKEGKKIDVSVLRESFTRVVLGLPLDEKVSEEEMRIVSYHEAGHAVVKMAQSSEGVYSVAYGTLKPYGKALGHIAYVDENKVLKLRSDLCERVRSLLAGRAVEDKLLRGDFTTGAGNDLMQANWLMYKMVTEYGMGYDTRNMHVLDISKVDMSEAWVKEEVDKLRDSLYEETVRLVEDNWNVIEEFALWLRNDQVIDQASIVEAYGHLYPVSVTQGIEDKNR